MGDENVSAEFVKKKPIGDLVKITNPSGGYFAYYNEGNDMQLTPVDSFKDLIVSGSKGEATPTSSPSPLLYKINITAAVTVNPGIGSTYTQGANTYRVDEVDLNDGLGNFSVAIVTGSAPTSSGALNKASGTGDDVINYSSVTIDQFEKWDIKLPGTYTNFKDASNNPIVVTTGDLDGNLVQIWVTNGVSKLEVTSLPQASQNIPNFIDLTFPALAGTQSVYLDKLWQVKTGQTATIADLPTEDLTSKWTLIGESVTQKNSNTVSVKTDALTTNQYFTDTDHFAGFGFLYTALKDFNQSIIKVGQIPSSSKPVTQVNLRICEDSYTGTELLRVNKTVSIADGVVQDVIFDHALIANTANKVLWVEFWTNGKTGLFKGNSSPTVPFRYKSDTMASTSTDGYNTISAAGASNNTRFYLALNKTSNETVLKDELVTEEIALGNERPPKSFAVAGKFAQYDNVIADAFINDTVITKGDTNVNTNNALIRGWGQLMGTLTDFNRVGFKLRPFDAGFIPTQVKCIIRKISSTGTVIFNQTKDVSLPLNVITPIYFDLDSTFINTAGDEIFVSFSTNGAVTLLGGSATVDFDAAHAVKYTTTSLSDTLASTNANLKHRLYCEIIKGHVVKQVSESETARIRGYNTPDLLYTSKAYGFPGKPFYVWNKNVCVPQFGDKNNNYTLNYDGSIARQKERGLELDPVPESLNQNMTLYLMRGRDILDTKIQNILSGALSNGSGVIRDLNILADSTGTDKKITGPIVDDIFATDVMKVRCVGEQGSVGYKHEARSGARIETFYGPGLPLYKINITTTLSIWPGIGSVYSQGANTYRVDEVNPTASPAYFSVALLTGSGPTASGTLTKVSGLGDAIINYSSLTNPIINKYYNPSTSKFDFAYYLSTTGQTFASNGWVIFQIGINNVFSAVTLADAQSRTEAMIIMYNEMIASIHAYDSTIRIGIVVTFPPADQNAFGENYSVGQFAEMYKKTGLLTWQKRLHQEYDNATSNTNRVYLIPAHLSVDTDYDYPTATRQVNKDNPATEIVQINAVHPNDYGNAKIARAIAAIIKYYG
jgi:hypothetical protein